MPCQKRASLCRIFGSDQKDRPRSFAVLADPEKMPLEDIPAFAKAIKTTFQQARKKFKSTHAVLLVGGSTVTREQMKDWMEKAGNHLDIPVVIFPGAGHQVVDTADAILFLSLISGDNPRYLIDEQRQAARDIKSADLDCISTGYILIEGGHKSAVERVSNTKPISQQNVPKIVSTAVAAELMGMQAVYLEAGSGAQNAVHPRIIKAVRQETHVPIITGGGLRNADQISQAYTAGADMVVVGTALENDLNWADKI